MAKNPLGVLVTGAAGSLHVEVFVYILSLKLFCEMEYFYIVLFQKILVVLFCVALFWKIIRHMWSFLDIPKEPCRVLVTGATGKLALKKMDL
ncbi:hypothetical protein WN943_017845 [Citrus x changshan-huyou]